MARTTFVLWCRSSCKDYCRAAPHVASRELCAAPHVARGDQRAALDAGSYRTLLERMVLKRTVLEQRALERMVLEQSAVPEPQLQTSLALATHRSPTRRLVRKGKRRLDARSSFHSCLVSRDYPPPGKPLLGARADECPLNTKAAVIRQDGLVTISLLRSLALNYSPETSLDVRTQSVRTARGRMQR